MKIRSEYTILAECIERGIELGYNRAYKYADNPSPTTFKNAIYDAVTTEISEYFTFDNEESFE